MAEVGASKPNQSVTNSIVDLIPPDLAQKLFSLQDSNIKISQQNQELANKYKESTKHNQELGMILYELDQRIADYESRLEKSNQRIRKIEQQTEEFSRKAEECKKTLLNDPEFTRLAKKLHSLQKKKLAADTKMQELQTIIGDPKSNSMKDSLEAIENKVQFLYLSNSELQTQIKLIEDIGLKGDITEEMQKQIQEMTYISECKEEFLKNHPQDEENRGDRESADDEYTSESEESSSNKIIAVPPQSVDTVSGVKYQSKESARRHHKTKTESNEKREKGESKHNNEKTEKSKTAEENAKSMENGETVKSPENIQTNADQTKEVPTEVQKEAAILTNGKKEAEQKYSDTPLQERKEDKDAVPETKPQTKENEIERNQRPSPESINGKIEEQNKQGESLVIKQKSGRSDKQDIETQKRKHHIKGQEVAEKSQTEGKQNTNGSAKSDTKTDIEQLKSEMNQDIEKINAVEKKPPEEGKLETPRKTEEHSNTLSNEGKEAKEMKHEMIKNEIEGENIHGIVNNVPNGLHKNGKAGASADAGDNGQKVELISKSGKEKSKTETGNTVTNGDDQLSQDKDGKIGRIVEQQTKLIQNSKNASAKAEINEQHVELVTTNGLDKSKPRIETKDENLFSKEKEGKIEGIVEQATGSVPNGKITSAKVGNSEQKVDLVAKVNSKDDKAPSEPKNDEKDTTHQSASEKSHNRISNAATNGSQTADVHTSLDNVNNSSEDGNANPEQENEEKKIESTIGEKNGKITKSSSKNGTNDLSIECKSGSKRQEANDKMNNEGKSLANEMKNVSNEQSVAESARGDNLKEAKALDNQIAEIEQEPTNNKAGKEATNDGDNKNLNRVANATNDPEKKLKKNHKKKTVSKSQNSKQLPSEEGQHQIDSERIEFTNSKNYDSSGRVEADAQTVDQLDSPLLSRNQTLSHSDSLRIGSLIVIRDEPSSEEEEEAPIQSFKKDEDISAGDFLLPTEVRKGLHVPKDPTENEAIADTSKASPLADIIPMLRAESSKASESELLSTALQLKKAIAEKSKIRDKLKEDIQNLKVRSKPVLTFSPIRQFSVETSAFTPQSLFQRTASSQTSVTGESISYQMGILEKQKFEMHSEENVKKELEGIKAEIEAAEKRVRECKLEEQQREARIKALRSEAEGLKNSIENEGRAPLSEEEKQTQIYMKEIEALDAKILVQQQTYDRLQSQSSALQLHLSDMRRIKASLDNELNDLHNREKPEVRQLIEDVKASKIQVEESMEKAAAAQRRIEEKRKEFSKLVGSEDMQKYRELKLKQISLERRLKKWNYLIKENRDSIQTIEAFSIQNAQRRKNLVETLASKNRALMKKEEEMSELEKYSQLIDAILAEHKQNWNN